MVNKLTAALGLAVLLSAGSVQASRLILYADSAHQDMEELLLQQMTIEEELAEFRKAIGPNEVKLEKLEAFLENRRQRKEVLDKEAAQQFGQGNGQTAGLVFYSYDRESPLGKKISIFHRSNLVLLQNLLDSREFLSYRQHLRERKREIRLKKAGFVLDELELHLDPSIRRQVVETMAALPGFLPRSNPESLATGFSQTYLVEREIQRLTGEKEFLKQRLKEILDEKPLMVLMDWYDRKIHKLQESESVVTLDEDTRLIILVPNASTPVNMTGNDRKRLFLDCMEDGVALVPMEKINYLSRSVLRSYGFSSRGDAARLVSFLQGRDLLVENYRVELDYLRNGVIYLTREDPWSEADLIKSGKLLKIVRDLDTDKLEFFAFVRDGADEQFRALEKFLGQIGFSVEQRKVGIEEPVPVYLPGLEKTFQKIFQGE